MAIVYVVRGNTRWGRNLALDEVGVDGYLYDQSGWEFVAMFMTVVWQLDEQNS